MYTYRRMFNLGKYHAFYGDDKAVTVCGMTGRFSTITGEPKEHELCMMCKAIMTTKAKKLAESESCHDA